MTWSPLFVKVKKSRHYVHRNETGFVHFTYTHKFNLLYKVSKRFFSISPVKKQWWIKKRKNAQMCKKKKFFLWGCIERWVEIPTSFLDHKREKENWLLTNKRLKKIHKRNVFLTLEELLCNMDGMITIKHVCDHNFGVN